MGFEPDKQNNELPIFIEQTAIERELASLDMNCTMYT